MYVHFYFFTILFFYNFLFKNFLTALGLLSCVGSLWLWCLGILLPWLLLLQSMGQTLADNVFTTEPPGKSYTYTLNVWNLKVKV